MAVFVMAFALATSLTTVQFGYNALDTARSTTLATQIVQSTMENLHLQNWSTISAYSASQPVDLSTVFGGSLPAAKHYACTLYVSDVSGQADMKHLTVEVSWTGLDGRTHQLSTTSFYAKDGLYDYFYTVH